MAEDRPEEIEPSPDTVRAKRAPPTIDLQATEISGETRTAGADAGAAADTEASADAEPGPSVQRRPMISSVVTSAATGACAAALVIAVAWLMGWPGQEAPPPAPAVNATAIDDLAARIASVESKAGEPPASDPAAAARVDALEKSVAALRSELAGLRAQSEKLASAVNDVKSTPHDSAPAPDLSAINDRIAGLERAARAQSTEIAQESAKPADDLALRRIVAASLLDVLVRIGDPYPAALTAAKSLAPSPDALKPLDGFAAAGVPSPAVLSRELLALVRKLSPPPAESTTGTGLVDRLRANASKLVRIERTDAIGNDPGNVVARVTAAALRNDYKEARRELLTLPAADRAAAQAWLEKADSRDAALAVSRQFADEAMTALARPAL
jgi:hypothetical protein